MNDARVDDVRHTLYWHMQKHVKVYSIKLSKSGSVFWTTTPNHMEFTWVEYRSHCNQFEIFSTQFEIFNYFYTIIIFLMISLHSKRISKAYGI
jgi:alpha-galactosidase